MASVYQITNIVGQSVTITPNVSSLAVNDEIVFNVGGTNTAVYTVTSVAGPDTVDVSPTLVNVTTAAKLIDLPEHRRLRLLGYV